MSRIHSRWGCRIIGVAQDLLALEDMVQQAVRESDSFFFSRIDSAYILRTSKWDNLDEPHHIYQEVKISISVMTGALSLYRHTNPFKTGAIVEFDNLGKIINEHFSTPSTIPGRIKKVRTQLFGRLLYSDDKHIREALLHFSDRADWFKLFMTYEALRSYYGTEKKFFQKFPNLRDNLDRVRRTANHHRHASNPSYLVPNPIDIGVAKSTLRQVFEQIAETLPPRPINDFVNCGYEYRKYETSGGLSLTHFEISELLIVDD